MKNKFMNRFIVIMMAAILMASVVGCGTTKTGQQNVSLVYDNAANDTPAQLEIQKQIKTMGEEITVLIWPDFNDLRCEMNEQRYEQLCGGKINWICAEGYSELQQKLASMHMSDSAPDLYPFSNQDFPSILYKNILAPLDDYIDLDNEVFAERKKYIDELRWDGECFFIPDIASPRDMYVCKSILVDAGIPESEWPDAQYKNGTWDWNSFLDIVKRTSNPDEGIYGFASSINLLYAFAASAGADFVEFTEDGIVPNLKSEEIVRSMNMMKTVISNPNWHAINTGEHWLELLKRGKVTMCYDMLEITADDILGEQLQNGDIFFVPFPRDPNVDKFYRMGEITGWAIPLTAKHRDGAVAFILSKFASDFYTKQINDINKEYYHWDDSTVDYYYNDLMQREAVLCYSLGIKEIQQLMWSATSTESFTQNDWETIANNIYPEMKKELDMLG